MLLLAAAPIVLYLIAFLVHAAAGAGAQHRGRIGTSPHTTARSRSRTKSRTRGSNRIKRKPSKRLFGVPVPLDPVKVLLINYGLVMHILGLVLGPLPIALRWCLAHLVSTPAKKCEGNCESAKPRAIKDIKFTEKNPVRLDVYTRCCTPVDPSSPLKPVILFIYGGAWSTGSKAIYAPLACNLERAGYVVIVPDYTLFPTGMVEDALDDVAAAVLWARKFSAEYGGDPDRIHMMGHSAGGHLVAMALVRAAVNEARRSSIDSIPALPGEMRPPLSCFNPRVAIKSAILLAGVYDISAHFIFESDRGVEEISAMERCMSQTHECFEARSPGELLRLCRQQSQVVFSELLPQVWLFLHGDADTTVPPRESEKFHSILEWEFGVSRSKVKLLKGVGHFDIISGITVMDSDYMVQFLRDVAQVVTRAV
ncbi:Alpha/Beta hydrolase protein [Chytriomyces cf. hyalinus JEL632]|nr:Alpha/Beta hydrolase protein [Chytriomyces cf. hyalinus JEL632]